MRKTVMIFALAGSLFACRQNPGSTETGDSGAVDTPAETAVASEVPATLENIDDIQQWYAHILSRKDAGQLDSTAFTYDCSGEKGGTVTFYSDAGGVQLITHERHEYSHFEATNQYFVRNGQPFFIFYHHLSWSFDGANAQGESTTRDDITESRYYVIDNAVVQCLEKEYTLRSASEDKPDPAAVPNQETACPPPGELTAAFGRLMKYRDRTGKVGCLE